MAYTPSDIKWIKNITDSDSGRAYMDEDHGTFTLHFPNQHKGNILSPLVGDLIILYQNIDDRRVFTHLVSPIDNDRKGPRLDRSDYLYGREVKVIAFVPENELVDIRYSEWNNVSFQGVSQGSACKISNIGSVSSPDTIRESTWNYFESYLTGE